MDEAVVETAAHITADVIGEAPHAEALDRAHGLDAADHGDVAQCEGDHVAPDGPVVKNVVKALGQPPFEIGAGDHADVVD